MSELSPEKLAKESERLRQDQAFAEAVKAIDHDAQAAIQAAEAQAVEALLTNQNVDAARQAVVQARANKNAIDALTTAIAHQILRGTPRDTKPVA